MDLRKHQSQNIESKEWKEHKKHFFILSSSGKPIYSRYGDESSLSSLLGIVQAFISYFLQNKDPIKYIKSNDRMFVFYITKHLYYVCVSKTMETPEIIQQQLQILENQLIFSITKKNLESIFEKHPNYDLRSLLGGTDILLDRLIKSAYNPHLFLNCIESIKIPAKLRRAIQKSWSNASTQILFGLLVTNGKVLHMYNPKKQLLSPRDVLLLNNLVHSSTSFRAIEAWTPACLPEFHSQGFLYSYSCFLMPDICIILLSTDKDAFFELSGFKNAFLQNFEQTGYTQFLLDSINLHTFSVVELGIPGLRHFLFKFKDYFVEANTIPPYTSKNDRKRLLILYQKGLVLCKNTQGTISYQVTDHETVVYQVL